MRGVRRIAVDVGTGMAAVFAAAAARSAIAGSRLARGLARRREARQRRQLARQAARIRELAREQLRADAHWVEANADTIHQFLDISAHASARLSYRDNAQRGGAAYIDMCSVARDILDEETRSGAAAKRLDAMRRKIHDLEMESLSSRQRIVAAETELAALQEQLMAQLAVLRRDAPPAEVAVAAARLVEAHDAARRGPAEGPGAVDEALVQHRLEQVTTLRDKLDQTLGRLAHPPE